MRPKNLNAKIFLDGSDTEQTKTLLGLLGFLDGQTTNPSNFASSPEVAARIARGEKFSQGQAFAEYRKRVSEISNLLPDGAISVEVYADPTTTAAAMFKQGQEMFAWVPNAYVKYPTTAAGLEAAQRSVAEGMRVNMTLVFTQAQAAAVYAATKGAKRGDVFISPFIGRLNDRGQNGINLIENVIKMYQQGDGHVLVLTSSIRTVRQFTQALAIGTDCITAYFAAIEDWGKQGMPLPDRSTFADEGLNPITYQSLELNRNWQEYDIRHELTDKGMERFTNDWNALIK